MLPQRAIAKFVFWLLVYFACWLTSFTYLIGEKHLLRHYTVWCFTFTGFELPFAVLLLSLILFVLVITLFFIGRLVLRKGRASA